MEYLIGTRDTKTTLKLTLSALTSTSVVAVTPVLAYSPSPTTNKRTYNLLNNSWSITS